jgi:hypothetical protein
MLTETLPSPVVEVQVLDPYNPQETLKDKLTIVDVKARDAAGRVFQVEIQLSVYADLTPTPRKKKTRRSFSNQVAPTSTPT